MPTLKNNKEFSVIYYLDETNYHLSSSLKTNNVIACIGSDIISLGKMFFFG